MRTVCLILVVCLSGYFGLSQLAAQSIDSVPLTKCEHQGTIVTDDFPNEDGVSRKCLIYLPYGYDESKQYDVIFLFHGDCGNSHNLIDDTHYADLHRWEMRDLYDNMIENGTMKPFILVSPEYLNWAWSVSYDKLGPELRDVVLPQFVEKYATYAKDGSHEELVKARNHFCFGGYSYGAMFTVYSILPSCLDVCSNYMIMSGGDPDEKIYDAINDSDYDIHMIYLVAGGVERQYGLNGLYKDFIHKTDKIQKNFNIRYDIFELYGHNWCTWTLGFYNGAPLMFGVKEEETDNGS